MRQKTYLQTVAGILIVVAIAHALRIANGWEIKISTLVVPMWVSWVGAVVAAYLGYSGLKFADKK